MKLKDKELAFIEHYLLSWNAADAARKAGYPVESARQRGHELVTKRDIQKEIERRLSTMSMRIEEWYARVTEQARADLGDFIDDNGKVDLKKAREEGKLRLLVEYSTKEFTRKDEEGNPYQVIETRIKLISSQKALELLARREDKGALLEAQALLLQNKLDQLAEKEALLEFLKAKASPEVYEEVVRVLRGEAKEPGKEPSSTIKLQWADARPYHQQENKEEEENE